MAKRLRSPGEEIGGYTVVGTLGRGGSADVYKVRDGGGHVAALKLVHASHDPATMHRLRREVEALRRLRHPGLPRVLDVEYDGEDPFVVFELVEGVSLADHVATRGPLRGAELADFAGATASALEVVHAADVVHRDVTPSNIMMSPTGPVLIDFGLAHRSDDARLTREGLVSGTAGYVAPEVIDGEVPGVAADQWSWAAVLAFAMTGEAPFGSGVGALSRTLEAHVDLPRVPGADEVEAAVSRRVDIRPRPDDVVAALRADADPDATSVLGVMVPRTTVMEAREPVSWAARVGDEVEERPQSEQSQVNSSQDMEWGFTPETEPWDADAAVPGGGLPGDTDALSEPTEARGTPRNSALGAGALLIVSGAAVAPFAAAYALAAGALVGRTAYRRAAALDAARAKRGQRRGDAVVTTVAIPWHLLRALVDLVPSLLVAAAAAVTAGGGGWWLANRGLLADTVGGAHWGRSLALAVGASAAIAALWWGPSSAATRDGARRVARAAAPTRRARTWWWVLAVAALVLVALLRVETVGIWWWPLPQMPGDT